MKRRRRTRPRKSALLTNITLKPWLRWLNGGHADLDVQYRATLATGDQDFAVSGIDQMREAAVRKAS
jgi:hypothetical protein